MKNAKLFIGGLALAATGVFAQAQSSFTGEIMDSSCAKTGSHAAMEKEHKMAHDAAACTQACVKAGAKYVLYNTATKTEYQLDDQTKPEAFAGKKVKVNGKLDAATKTIHVDSIAPAS